MSYHPSRQALERFARGEVFRHEARRIVNHLRLGCPACQQEVDRLLPFGEETGCRIELALPEELPSPMSTLDFERLEMKLGQIEDERRRAPDLLSEILALSERGRAQAIRSQLRYRTLAVCDGLIEQSFRMGFDDARGAVGLAELAIDLAEQLEPARYGRSLVQDLKGRAWAFLGNARRINSDLPGAEEALDLAQSLIEDGSADPLEQARVFDLRASLAADQGRFELAVEFLDMVIDIYGEVQEPHLLGRALLSKGLVTGLGGDSEAAIDLIRRSLRLLDLDFEPRLIVAVHHNLAWFIDEAGRHEEALEHLEMFGHIYQDFPDARILPRRRWLQGRIAAGLGRPLEAEVAFREVQRHFISHGLDCDAAMVAMDLAALLLASGRNAEVIQLTAEIFPVLMAQEVRRHALAALVAFTHAVEMNCATPKLASEVAKFLRRASRNPSLQFDSKL